MFYYGIHIAVRCCLAWPVQNYAFALLRASNRISSYYLLYFNTCHITLRAFLNRSVSITSKLNSLCRMTIERESAAFDAIILLEHGEAVEYEIIPL